MCLQKLINIHLCISKIFEKKTKCHARTEGRGTEDMKTVYPPPPKQNLRGEGGHIVVVVVVVVLLFYVHGKHLRSCRDGQLT